MMGDCKKCGASVAESGAFCPNCGAAMEVPEATGSTPQEFTFIKRKMMGNLTYKRTTTEITIVGNQVTMTQTLNRLFRSEKKEEKIFSTSSVASIRSHTVLDFWDTLYAIIFVVLGFFQPLLFLLALLCFWCGYGKEMELSFSDGGKIKIPYTGSKSNTEKFLAFCSCCGLTKSNNIGELNKVSAEKFAGFNQDSTQNVESTFAAQDFTRRPEETFEPAQKRKLHKLLIGIGIIVLGFLIFQFFYHTGYDIEYSNNAGDKLPIVITDINISERDAFYIGNSLATFDVINIENTDYRYARFAVLAWDNDGFPMKLNQPGVFTCKK